MSRAFDALYAAKNADGSWNFAWSTKLPVLAYGSDEHGLTGFVQNSVGDGVDAAYLVPALDLEITSTGGTQFFVRYIPAV